MHAIVVGGGVIGLCCATALRREGVDVTLLERDACGEHASRGNAGWVVPSLSGPRAAPGALWYALRRMARRDSPVRVRPSLDLNFARWVMRFHQCSRRARHRAGAQALVTLNRTTFDAFEALRLAGVEFEMQSSGLLIVGLSSGALDEHLANLDHLRQLGCPGEADVLYGDALRKLEPALSDAVTGGIHLRADRALHPEALTRGLVKHLLASGAEIREQTEVTGLVRDGGHRWGVQTRHERLVADRVLVAGGIWSKRLLRGLGLRLPLEGARGDSLTARGTGIRPRHALELSEAMVACTPFSDGMRLAGNYEIGKVDEVVNRRRLELIVRSAAPYLRNWRPREPLLEWAGIRPVTPDDLPYIGEVPGHEGLYLATGHGMLGVTLGPATGAALAPLIVEGRTSSTLEPFRVDRFERRHLQPAYSYGRAET